MTERAELAQRYASFGDVFVSDGFGVVHRKQASVYDLASRLPNAAGGLVLAEVEVLKQLTESPQRPYVVVLGGAKVSDKLAVIANLIKTADTLVIGLPVYNFFLPSQLKTWLDQIARAGVSFRYTAEGPEGLLTGKRAFVAYTAAGTPMGSDLDHASGYLRHMLGFLGITDVTFVAADGLATDREAGMARAQQALQQIAA